MTVLLALVVLFAFSSDHFLTALTFKTLANQIPALTVIAVGMTFVLIIAGIDLSVGSVMALGGAVLGVVLADFGAPLWVAALACLATGSVCGLLNGFVVTRWSIPSFIVTLGMLEMARGGAYLVTSSQTKYLGSSVAGPGSPIPGVGLAPSVLLAVFVVIAAQLLLTRTVFGRYAIAIGSNEEAARLSGIRVARWQLCVYTMAGLLAGLGGLLHVSYLQSADPNAGIGLELAAIAAVVIGGTSLAGGKGSVISTLLGVLIIAILQTGLAQLGISEPSKRLITGFVIVVAVIIDAYRNRAGGVRNWAHKVLRQ